MTRRKPVSRDEIRFNGEYIATMPIDAVQRRGRQLEPIKRLWGPVLEIVNREAKEAWNSGALVRAIRPHRRDEPFHPIGCPAPHWRDLGPYACVSCGRLFYRTSDEGRSGYCSDRCRDQAHAAAQSKAVSEHRAAARADRRCAGCGEPIEALRSTLRFCSVKCRVRAHRQARGIYPRGRRHATLAKV